IQEADHVAAGLKLIASYQPDLVFLDVMMPDGTGFDLLKQLPTIPFKLVIVSGHQEFALQAFRFSAIDYLIKPIDVDELQ
ncbi:MAG TPA: response regulator, partial [Cyclobacteriaceae bacterium]|nr:response regulator [Cyclobacteriaceae bacterium]